MKPNTKKGSGNWFSKYVLPLINPARPLVSYLYQWVPDSIKIWLYKDHFVFNELTQRAMKSANGIAKTSVGVPLLSHIGLTERTYFVVVTNENHVEEAVSYGEYDVKNKEKHDPLARKLFDGLRKFLWRKSVINLNDESAQSERHRILNILSFDKAREVSQQFFSKFLTNWKDDRTVNEAVFDTVTRIVAKSFFNMDNLPDELMPLLYEAETYVHENFQGHDQQIAALQQKLERLNTPYVKAHEKDLLDKKNSYLGSLDRESAEGQVDLTKINALGALIVGGNISALLTEVIILLASNPELQRTLQDELNNLQLPDNITQEVYNTKLRKAPFLHCFYLEALRYFSPTPTIPRYASKPGSIGGVAFPANTYILVPIRQILRKPSLWPNPNIFDPYRHDSTRNPSESIHQLHKSAFPPFSLNARKCPAAYGFAETVFKTGLAVLFKNNSLQLTHPQVMELIPIDAKAPRLHHFYHATLQRGVPLRRYEQKDASTPSHLTPSKSGSATTML